MLKCGRLPIKLYGKLHRAWPKDAAFRHLSSVEPTRHLNDNNMIHHHNIDTEVGPQEWTTFNGKIPILQHQHTPNDQADSILKETLLHNDSDTPKVSLLLELTDDLGALQDILKYFWKYDVSICRIESRPIQRDHQYGAKFDLHIDFHGSSRQAAVQKLLQDLGEITERLVILDEDDVRRFPEHVSDLNTEDDPKLS